MYILKKHEEKPVKISIKIYINKIENRIKFKIKTEYYLELLTTETLKLLGSTKSKTTKKKKWKWWKCILFRNYWSFAFICS